MFIVSQPFLRQYFYHKKVKCGNLQVIKLCKFLLQSTEITFIGSIDPHSIFFVGITKGKI